MEASVRDGQSIEGKNVVMRADCLDSRVATNSIVI